MNIVFKNKNIGAVIYSPQGEFVAVIKPVKTPKTGKNFKSIIEKAIIDNLSLDDAVLTDLNDFSPAEDLKKRIYRAHIQKWRQ